ncbi:MAG TPA: cytochrome P450 [Gaiellales bacterium]|jgi:cytochrome P450|nr:cytochrome P450 [Gaiellales bacterium]
MTVAAAPAAAARASSHGWRNAGAYLRDPLGFMTSLRRSHGTVVDVPFPGDHDFLFLSEPDLIRRVLVEERAAFVKGRALQAARRLLGDGLLTSEGADHRRRRRLIQPVFHSALIERYGTAMVDAAERSSDRLQAGAVVDANAEMTRLALEIVGRTIFDADVEADAPEIGRVLQAGMRVFHRFLLPGGELMWRLPLPATRRFNAARAAFDDAVFDLIRERREPRLEPDLIDHLLALTTEDGRRALSDAEIRDEAVTLLLAGHETTAQALTWTWYLLARNAAASERLAEELQRVVGDRRLEVSDVPNLPYTTAVFRESLRVYPPVWALARIATRPVELDGLTVQEGRPVVMSQWVVHRDPACFERPQAFIPERWLGGFQPAPGTYFPFGAGSRICIGERFAMLEGTLVLATLARRWRLVPHAPAPRIDPRFTLRPHGGMPATVRPAPAG